MCIICEIQAGRALDDSVYNDALKAMVRELVAAARHAAAPEAIMPDQRTKYTKLVERVDAYRSAVAELDVRITQASSVIEEANRERGRLRAALCGALYDAREADQITSAEKDELHRLMDA